MGWVEKLLRPMLATRGRALLRLCIFALLSGAVLETVGTAGVQATHESNTKRSPHSQILGLRAEPQADANVKVDDTQLPGLLGGAGSLLQSIFGGAAHSKSSIQAIAAAPTLLPPSLTTSVNVQPTTMQVSTLQAPPPPGTSREAGGGILGGIIGSLLGNAPVLQTSVPLAAGPPPAVTLSPESRGGTGPVPLPAPASMAPTEQSRVLEKVGDLLSGALGILPGVVDTLNGAGVGAASPGMGPIAIPDPKDIMNAAASAVAGNNVPLLDAVSAAVEKTMDVIKGAVDQLAPALNGATGVIVPVADGVSGVLQHPPLGDVLGEVADTLANATQQITGLAGDVVDPIGKALPVPLELGNILDKAAGTIDQVAQGVKDLICTVEQVDAVSVLLRKPCTAIAASLSTVLTTQSSLSIVVTSATGTENVLATVTNSAGSTILPSLSVSRSVEGLASTAGALPLSGALSSTGAQAAGTASLLSALESALESALGTSSVSLSSPLVATSLPLSLVISSGISLAAPPTSALLATTTASSSSSSLSSLLSLSSFSAALSSSSVVGAPLAVPTPSTPSPQPKPSDLLPGPCPGRGYTCDRCSSGWFCPPADTPAQQGTPCGFGWPCDDCITGWFCVPDAQAGKAVGAGQAAVCEAMPSASVVAGPGAQPPRPALALPRGRYAGCYMDSNDRALRDMKFLGREKMIPMDNGRCLDMCRDAGYKIAGTEDGTECYCGDYVYNSYLVDDSRCSSPCSGDTSSSCGGPWALAVYSLDGRVEVRQPAFSLTEPPAGTEETSVHVGGVRQTVVPMTMAVYMWPPPAGNVPPPAPTSSTCTTTSSSMRPGLDGPGLVASVGSMVSEAMQRASSVEADVLSRASTAMQGANSMVGEMMSLVSAMAQQTAGPVQVMPGPVVPGSCLGPGGCGQTPPTPGSVMGPPAGPVVVTYGRHGSLAESDDSGDAEGLWRRHARGRMGISA